MKKAFPWLTIIITGGIIIFIGLIIYIKSLPGQYDNLSRCLTEKGIKFYGAFWCQHCQDQKNEFGKSEKLLPYIECSTPDGKDQLPICKEKNIASYPTWIFPDGEIVSKVYTPEELAKKTTCPAN